jgi:hypothetical protein
LPPNKDGATFNLGDRKVQLEFLLMGSAGTAGVTAPVEVVLRETIAKDLRKNDGGQWCLLGQTTDGNNRLVPS